MQRLPLVLLVLLMLVTPLGAADTYLGSGGSYGTPGLVSTSAIDGKTVANTTIATNTSGTDFYVTSIHIVLTAVSGLGTPPVVSVGITSAGYTDFVNAFALTSLTAANTVLEPTLVGVRARVPNGTALVCRVATAAIATTTYQFSIVVRGFYL
jgi:hypothetical protein